MQYKYLTTHTSHGPYLQGVKPRKVSEHTHRQLADPRGCKVPAQAHASVRIPYVQPQEATWSVLSSAACASPSVRARAWWCVVNQHSTQAHSWSTPALTACILYNGNEVVVIGIDNLWSKYQVVRWKQTQTLKIYISSHSILYVCVCVQVRWMRRQWVWKLYILCVCVYLSVCVCLCMHEHTYIDAYKCMHVCLHVCVYSVDIIDFIRTLKQKSMVCISC